jgi:hypothetical protein
MIVLNQDMLGSGRGELRHNQDVSILSQGIPLIEE